MLVFGASAARAELIKDPAAWTKRFVQAASKGDADAMVALVEASATPSLNVGSVKAEIQTVVKGQGPQPPDFAEAFDEKNLGSFFKRINVAVIARKGDFFYSFALGRYSDGWMIFGFKANSDVNEIVNTPWPS